MLNLGILISGRGSNMESILKSIKKKKIPINPAVVISNKANAKGLLFDDIFYTGDICTRKRGFLQGAKIPKCKTLITECTFGLPEFIFPTIDKIQKQVNELISGLYGKGIPVILMGYQLGKAQTITQLFGHWEPLFFHDSVKEMKSLHQKLGIPLKDGIGHSEAEKKWPIRKKTLGDGCANDV